MDSLWGEHVLLGRTAYHMPEQHCLQAFRQCDPSHCSLQDAVRAIMCRPTPCFFPRVAPAGEAPACPNVYTDGSVSHPRYPIASPAGAGVVWPGRTSQLSAAERDCIHLTRRASDEHAHVTHLIPYQGVHCNSTRMEILAGLHAMLANDAVHMCSDSLALKSGHERVCKYVQGHGRQGLANRANSDLWSQWAWILQLKGAHSTRVTWVKGHTSREEAARRGIAEKDRVWNERADLAADEAVNMLGAQAEDPG